MRYSRIRRYKEADCDAHSGHETLRQSEGDGVIEKNNQYLVDVSDIAVPVYESKEVQGQP